MTSLQPSSQIINTELCWKSGSLFNHVLNLIEEFVSDGLVSRALFEDPGIAYTIGTCIDEEDMGPNCQTPRAYHMNRRQSKTIEFCLERI